jgi:hypothetical protein
MSKTPSDQSKINDRCPSWAVQVIARIRDIEIEAGNINPGGDWQQKVLSDLQGRAFPEDGESTDDAELLFQDLAKRLTSEGFSAEEIAQFVNVRILSGGKLLYCSVAEVLEAIG